jgi:microcystin degradation protein MlrC
MEDTNRKSLTELIQSNPIALTSAKAFLTLGVATISAASNIKIGLDILQHSNNHPALMGLLGIQGVGAIIFGYKSAMHFAELGQILEEDSHKPATVKPRMK